MLTLNSLNNNSKSLKEEIIKSKIEDSYQAQLTDYIYLQKKLNSIRNLLLHKSKLSPLDYTKINRYYNFSKTIIVPKKFSDDDIESKNQKSNKNYVNDIIRENKARYLSNPILKKIFLSKEEDISKNNIRTKSASIRYNKDLKRMKNMKTNYLNFRPKNNLYKLPNQIKNKFNYNLDELKNNKIKRKYVIKEKLSKFDKFAKYFLRGLSLSEEQNLIYQRCKKIDLSSEDKKNKKKYEYLNTLDDYKRKKDKFFTRFTTIVKKEKNQKKAEINFVQNYNRNLFKYSLKDLLKMENPIKIIL